MAEAPKTRAPRAEIARSRAAILEEAERFFTEFGVDASLHTLARRARVGVATLFRRFPTRDDLIRALYDRVIERFDAVMETAKEQTPVGRDRLEFLLRRGVDVLLDSPIIPGLLERMAAIEPDYRPGERWITPLAESVSVAIEAGDIRADATPLDIAAMPYLFNGLSFFQEPVRRVIAARQLDLLLDGLRSDPDPDASRHPEARRVSAEQFHQSLHHTVT